MKVNIVLSFSGGTITAGPPPRCLQAEGTEAVTPSPHGPRGFPYSTPGPEPPEGSDPWLSAAAVLQENISNICYPQQRQALCVRNTPLIMQCFLTILPTRQALMNFRSGLEQHSPQVSIEHRTGERPDSLRVRASLSLGEEYGLGSNFLRQVENITSESTLCRQHGTQFAVLLITLKISQPANALVRDHGNLQLLICNC